MSYFFSARWPKVELINIFYSFFSFLQSLHLSLKDNGNKSDFKTQRREFLPLLVFFPVLDQLELQMRL